MGELAADDHSNVEGIVDAIPGLAAEKTRARRALCGPVSAI